MNGQLSIPNLWESRPKFNSSSEECHAWMVRHFECTEASRSYVERLFKEFGRVEGYDRSKVIQKLDGKHRVDGWSLDDAEYIGLFDHATDYHALWDRAWAIVMCAPRELVPKIQTCSYGGEPEFYDADGNLIFKSIYSRGGRILTTDERRALLAGDSL